MQRDNVSALISMGGYSANTLTGPSELLSRKIQATNNIVSGTDDFSQVTFRIMASAGRTLMNSRVIACFPLRVGNLQVLKKSDGTDAADDDWDQEGLESVCPRKSAGLQIMRQVAVTVNSTTSQSTRPEEWLTACDAMFANSDRYLLCGEGAEETANWDSRVVAGVGGVHATDIPASTDATEAAFQAAMVVALNKLVAGSDQVNKGAAYRRKTFIKGITATKSDVVFTVMTEIPLAPFLRYRYPEQYRKNPKMVPFCSNIDILCSFKSNMKNYLLQALSQGECGNKYLHDYDIEWAANPYLKCTFVTTPTPIPVSLVQPSSRLVHYRRDVTAVVQAVGPSRVSVTFAQLRLESFPSVLQFYVEQRPGEREEPHNFSWKPYFAPIVEGTLKIRIGERGSLLSGQSNYELYSMYRRNAGPGCSTDFATWEAKQCQILIRSDQLSHTSQGVYDPVTCTISATFECPEGIGARTAAEPLVARLNMWYHDEALTLSQASSASSSFLISQSDISLSSAVRDPAVAAQAQIQDFATYQN